MILLDMILLSGVGPEEVDGFRNLQGLGIGNAKADVQIFDGIDGSLFMIWFKFQVIYFCGMHSTSVAR